MSIGEEERDTRWDATMDRTMGLDSCDGCCHYDGVECDNCSHCEKNGCDARKVEADGLELCDSCHETVPIDEAFHWNVGTFCDPCAGAML